MFCYYRAKGNASMTEARHFQRIWSSEPLKRLKLFSNGFWYMYPARSYRGPAGFSMASSSCWARTCRCTGEDFGQNGFHWMFCCILHDIFRIIQSVSWSWLIRRTCSRKACLGERCEDGEALRWMHEAAARIEVFRLCHFKNKWTSPVWDEASPENFEENARIWGLVNGSCGQKNVNPRHCKASTVPCALWPNSFTARATWLMHRSGSGAQRTRRETRSTASSFLFNKKGKGSTDQLKDWYTDYNSLVLMVDAFFKVCQDDLEAVEQLVVCLVRNNEISEAVLRCVWFVMKGMADPGSSQRKDIEKW